MDLRDGRWKEDVKCNDIKWMMVFMRHLFPSFRGVPARRGVRLLLLENEWFRIP